jgi:integral membrane protein
MISLKALRVVALAEATSFLALLVAAYFKHSGQSEVGVQVIGPIHGVLFLAFVVLTLAVRPDTLWSNRTTAWILAAAVLPFGGYVFDWWLTRRWIPRESAAAG